MFYPVNEYRESDLSGFNRSGTTTTESESTFSNGEFDPGSGRTLAACLTHASLGVAIPLAHG